MRPSAIPGARDRNRLLAALPATTYAQLSPRLTSVALTAGYVVSEADARIRHVYFPRSAMMSMVSVMANGAAAEVGTIGDEGFVGLAVLLGAQSATSRCIVQIAGDAARISSAGFRTAIRESAPLGALLRLYAHTFISQVGQTAACNGLHPLGARCARWLLMTDDRAPGVDLTQSGGAGPAGFLLTQEYLSYMLGVRREGVSEAARQLQAAGLIRYVRGRITVIDRAGLEAASCECYRIVRAEQARLFD